MAAAYRRVISREFICRTGASRRGAARGPETADDDVDADSELQTSSSSRCGVASRSKSSLAAGRSEPDGNDPWGAEDADNSSISRRRRGRRRLSARPLFCPRRR